MGAEVLGDIGKDSLKGRGRHKLLKMLYRVVFQAVLLFGLESWILLEAMEKMVEGAHTILLNQIRRSWCGRTRTGHGKNRQKGKCGKQWGHSRRPPQLAADRGLWIIGWRCALSKKYAQGIRVKREGGEQEGLMMATGGTSN